jgi:type IV pilus assembly protein PilX
MKSIFFQRGASLVISLVLLGVVTLVGVASMQSSTLNLKLVASSKDRSTAFQAAEAALAAVEQDLVSNPPGLDKLSNNCTGANCFIDCTTFNSAAATKGRCFQGIYLNGQGKANCVLGGKAAIDPVQQIKNGNYIASVSPILKDNKTVQVLVEFMCFVEKTSALGNGSRISSEENSTTNVIEALNTQLAPMYRLTAVADGNALRSHVVAQSTFRLAE